MSDKKEFCSFCGNHKNEVTKLIVGDDVAICSSCIDLCNQLIIDEKKTASSSSTPMYDACVIKEYLDNHIVGQDEAKKTLAVAISNHYKRINHPSDEIELRKGNVLLIGPTGSGKTLLAKTVAKYLNVPYVIADATNLTEAGYVGEDVESMISMLLSMANNDVSLAERGIVFIDEIDKISRKSENASLTRDVSGEGVQQALLKLVEGTKCHVSLAGKRKNPNAETIVVDTKNILFIAGGAFVGLEKIIEGRKNLSSIGFGANIKEKSTNSDLSDVIPDDLVRFGMIPEFIGRFTTTVALENLTVDQLVLVLTTVRNSFIDQYKYMFSLDQIELVFTEDAIRQLAKNCIDLETGARGLHTELERILMPHMYNIRTYKERGMTELVIDAELVINPESLF